jgi:hypothetical protein
MKKAKKASSPANGAPSRRRSTNDMRAEYDFTGGVRGKYARAFARGSNVIVLEPDLAAEFPSANAVNRALRAYLKVKAVHRTT